MPDIFLRQGDGTSTTILLRDPTQADAGGAITAAIAESQAAQSEAIVAAEKYSATIAESQAAQSEAISAAEKYSATIAEAQAQQTESITAAERFTATLAEAQAAQTEAITGTVAAAGAITADIVEAQAQQSEAIVAKSITPPPVIQRPQQLVGMGGRWYTYRDLFGKGKKKLEEKKAIPPAPKKREPELSPVLEAALQRMGNTPRRRVAFKPIDIEPVQRSVLTYMKHEAHKTRERREREAVEV